jgi:hypothetical protein
MALLDDVTTALLGAGYSDPFDTTPAVRLRCLFAASRLEALGTRADRARAMTACLADLNGSIVVAIVVTMLLEISSPSDDLALDEARQALHDALTALG